MQVMEINTDLNLLHMEPDNNHLQKKIVIIGAGIAGLSCAATLKEQGFTNVRILEAKNKIGGRIHTVHLGSSFIELGAQWIHGQKTNAVYELAASNGLVDDSAPDYFAAIMKFNGLQGGKLELTKNLIAFLDNKLCDFPTASESTSDIPCYLKKHYINYLKENKIELNFIPLIEEVYNWYTKFLCELNGCSTLASLSGSLLKLYKECEGLPCVELKNGYCSVVELLLEKIPSEWIIKEKCVSLVDWRNLADKVDWHIANFDQSKSVEIHCKDGTVYLANHVIITIPLGCLKKMEQSLFLPSLPYKKRVAIYATGFGIVNKIFLEFEKPFWNDASIYNTLWPEASEQLLQEYSSQEKWIKYVTRFAYTPGHPKMLCAWVVGEGAKLVEALSDDEIIEDFIKALEILLEIAVPKPCRIFRSSWLSDPFSCGSYCYLSTECEKKNITPMDLAEPVYSKISGKKNPILMFAGEATHPYYFSTVHGAYESGVREADRLLHRYRNNIRCSSATQCDSPFFTRLQAMLQEKTLREKLKIVIVGAGIAGLACAFELAQNQFTNITILEAQSTIGGRVSTKAYGDYFLELGAQWIHGQCSKLYDFCKMHKLLCRLSDEPSYEGKGVFCSSSGKIISISYVNEVKTLLDTVKLHIDEGKYNDSSFPKSVAEFFSDAFNTYISSCQDASEKFIKTGIYNWYIKYELIDNACNDLNEVAARSYTQWSQCSDQPYHINFKNGYSALIDTLRLHLQHSVIHVNKPVKCIHWGNKSFQNCSGENVDEESENYHVLLECENGQTILADSVIVTASAGFIKENMDKLFDPALPEEKVNSFFALGFGTINKIYLIFSKPFWNKENLGFQLIWTDDEAEQNETFLYNNPWVRGITGFDVVRKQPNVLLGWIGGKEAEMMESVDEEKIGQTCVYLLRKFLNKSDIPYPERVIRSCWCSNPYVRGAYSFRTIQFYHIAKNYQALQSPLCVTYTRGQSESVEWPVVMFAGEATDECCFSSAHGAFHSGLREAKRLLVACADIEQDDGIF